MITLFFYHDICVLLRAVSVWVSNILRVKLYGATLIEIEQVSSGERYYLLLFTT